MLVSPEKLAPAYWAGHSFDDQCSGIRANYYSDTTEEKTRRQTRQRDKEQRSKLVKARLKQVDIPTMRIVDSITDGLFDGSQYPEGTIVRLYDEKVWRDKKLSFRHLFDSIVQMRVLPKDWDEPTYYSGTEIGVLSKSAEYAEFQQTRLITFSEWKFGANHRLSRWSIEHWARISVGQVEHWRYNDDFGLNDSESLSRINQIDILDS